MALVDPGFIEEVRQSDQFNASACLNCGVCSAVCPMGIELLPRKLFRYVLLGIREKVLENIDTIYSCLLCKMCEVNCPGGVHIAENVRYLRYYINKRVFKL
ncbi:MAG: 4Fe-4S dicluster domain-containing protein [Thermoanaerobacteraceae bacterium]|uniref:4Fe-4S dicluster domain-containing protein n=1 Tax=Desulfofundulus thermobenzoicus TaxID=29376 RepID=A0A6N7IUV9_9FIRM|nr:4Fe-4S dicluster domain-containing protein [Desulfofundulus thermobenzoicus]MBE3588090.1 4Fe-4S dicluster domain-containing protein [Thermoanaerobacteraceae bacterium]MQL53906.1 4Fe-4S dicluster domain-containing protein [Desulfofundulus thermobenzoicus]HHW44860.1 4Fe-4S dicluster domain-containing protein [Desulfotomaculum sp.]